MRSTRCACLWALSDGMRAYGRTSYRVDIQNHRCESSLDAAVPVVSQARARSLGGARPRLRSRNAFDTCCVYLGFERRRACLRSGLVTSRC